MPGRLLTVLAWLGGLSLIWFFCNMTEPGRYAGYWGLAGTSVIGGRTNGLLRGLASLGSPGACLFGLLLSGVMALAMRHRGAARALLAGVLLLLSARVLKGVLPLVDHGIFPFSNGMPSGHAAGFLALIIGWSWLGRPLARRRLRTLIILTACSSGYSYAVMAVSAHTPGDILASIALAGFWTALLLRPGSQPVPPVIALSVAAAPIPVAVVLSRYHLAGPVLLLFLISIAALSWLLWAQVLPGSSAETTVVRRPDRPAHH